MREDDWDGGVCHARRRIAHAAVPASRINPAINPHGVSVGASAAALAHVPTCPDKLHFSSGSLQALLQQTLSTQNPGGPHWDDVLHAPPIGTGVSVGVAVGVVVGVLVGVAVAVLVGVTVGVCVDVLVGVAVAVSVGVLVGV